MADEKPFEMDLSQVEAAIVAAGPVDVSFQEQQEDTGEDADNDACTCGVSSITLRFERSADCPIHKRARVTFDSIAWERISEQTRCICGDVKGVHRREPHGGTTRCGSGNAPAFRAIAARLAAKPAEQGPPPPVVQGCRCPGFYDVDAPLPWLDFADRLLGEFDPGHPAHVVTEDLEGGGIYQRAVPARPNLQARARAALGWAWKASHLPTNAPLRTWNQWLADSKRVWRAWRDAGSPIVAFGKPASFGPAAIPALEDR